jgi:hypothetical protein
MSDQQMNAREVRQAAERVQAELLADLEANDRKLAALRADLDHPHDSEEWQAAASERLYLEDRLRRLKLAVREREAAERAG